MIEPGGEHEAAGRALLAGRGIPDTLTRFCVTHARWDAPDCTVEDMLVALADKLWKGKRELELEERLGARVAEATGREPWRVWDAIDRICETIAADGPARLARSAVF
jgi:hypothetical protein